VDELFGIFDTMLSQGKTVGILKDPGVPPGHEVDSIPEWSALCGNQNSTARSC